MATPLSFCLTRTTARHFSFFTNSSGVPMTTLLNLNFRSASERQGQLTGVVGNVTLTPYFSPCCITHWSCVNHSGGLSEANCSFLSILTTLTFHSWHSISRELLFQCTVYEHFCLQYTNCVHFYVPSLQSMAICTQEWYSNVNDNWYYSRTNYLIVIEN